MERLAEALPQGIEDPGFEILLRRIDGAPFFGGNEVEVYFEGRTAFSAMRDAVRAAKQEVLLESYIFKDDSTGRQFLGEIQAAAERGIKVRVLADAVGSYETRAEFWQEMESHGIEFFLFHPLFKSLWYQPFRDHRKILVVDREVAFTGGMNIGEEYGSWQPPAQAGGDLAGHPRADGRAGGLGDGGRLLRRVGPRRGRRRSRSIRCRPRRPRLPGCGSWCSTRGPSAGRRSRRR